MAAFMDLTCCTMFHLYISLTMFIFWIYRSMHLIILLKYNKIYMLDDYKPVN